MKGTRYSAEIAEIRRHIVRAELQCDPTDELVLDLHSALDSLESLECVLDDAALLAVSHAENAEE